MSQDPLPSPKVDPAANATGRISAQLTAAQTLMIEECKELGNNMRLLTTTRFASLTVAFAFQAALVSALLQPGNVGTLRILLKAVAISLVGLSAINEHRIITLFSRASQRAAQLEHELGFNNYLMDSGPRILTIRNALRLIHLALVAFWVVALATAA